MEQALEISYRPQVLPDTSVVHLQGQATFRQAPELRRQIFQAVGARDTERLVVELADVEAMDTAAMAVLVEALMATRQDGPNVYFCTPSESVRKVFELAGLERALSRCYGCIGDLPEQGDQAKASGVDCACDA